MSVHRPPSKSIHWKVFVRIEFSLVAHTHTHMQRARMQHTTHWFISLDTIASRFAYVFAKLFSSRFFCIFSILLQSSWICEKCVTPNSICLPIFFSTFYAFPFLRRHLLFLLLVLFLFIQFLIILYCLWWQIAKQFHLKTVNIRPFY